MTPGTPFDLARPVEHPVVGQRYLLRPRPVEFACPGCGWILGTDANGEPDTSVRIATVRKASFHITFHHACGRRNIPLPEGWWIVQSPDGKTADVPWTWLYPLEDGDA